MQPPSPPTSPPAPPSRPITRLACVLLVTLGLLASIYLFSRSLALQASPWPRGLDLCATLFSSSCDATLLDDQFRLLGVPLAGWGIVYFSTLAGLFSLGRLLGPVFAAEAVVAANFVSLAGAAGAVAIATSSWLHHQAFCPLCLLVQASLLLLPFALQRASAQSLGEQGQVLRRAAAWLLRTRETTPIAVHCKLLALACAALIAVVATQWVYVESTLRLPHAPAPDRAGVISAYRVLSQSELPVSEADPHLGPLDAPVRLVVFASFRCPGCRQFAATLAQLRRRFGDQLLIVYKHYPLSTECNERLTDDRQPGACEAARAAEAAHRQGQFWNFHDALFAAGTDAGEEAIAQVVHRLKLDPARFATDRQAEETQARVAQDVALGTQLHIPGTPSVFVDGRLVRPASREILEILIREELEAQAAGANRHRGRRPWPG